MSDLLTALRSGAPVLAAELRPPRAELAMGEGMDAWIDTYHQLWDARFRELDKVVEELQQKEKLDGRNREK